MSIVITLLIYAAISRKFNALLALIMVAITTPITHWGLSLYWETMPSPFGTGLFALVLSSYLLLDAYLTIKGHSRFLYFVDPTQDDIVLCVVKLYVHIAGIFVNIWSWASGDK